MDAEQAGGLGVGPVPDELGLVLGVELLEHVRLELVVLADRLDDLLALLVGGGLDQVGDLGRAELARASGRGCAAWRSGRGRRRARCSPSRPWDPARSPARAGRGSRRSSGRLDGSTATTSQRAVHLGQLDLVGLDDPAAHEVDGVAGQQVAGEEQLARAALEAAQVDPGAVEADPAGLEGGDLADRHEQVARPDGHHQAHDRGVRARRRGGRRGPGPRPIRSPVASTRGRFTMFERWRISGSTCVSAFVRGSCRAQA